MRRVSSCSPIYIYLPLLLVGHLGKPLVFVTSWLFVAEGPENLLLPGNGRLHCKTAMLQWHGRRSRDETNQCWHPCGHLSLLRHHGLLRVNDFGLRNNGGFKINRSPSHPHFSNPPVIQRIRRKFDALETPPPLVKVDRLHWSLEVSWHSLPDRGEIKQEAFGCPKHSMYGWYIIGIYIYV